MLCYVMLLPKLYLYLFHAFTMCRVQLMFRHRRDIRTISTEQQP